MRPAYPAKGEHCGPRPPSTTPATSSIGRRLTNLPALREIGFHANRRLLGVQRLEPRPDQRHQRPAPATDPVITSNGTRVPGLPWGSNEATPCSPRCRCFRLQPDGFTNRDLRPLIAELRGLPPEAVTIGQMTYDLRRLRLHGLIPRIQHTHRYRVTDTGLQAAIFLSAVSRPAPTHRTRRPRRINPDPAPHRQQRLPTAVDAITHRVGFAA